MTSLLTFDSDRARAAPRDGDGSGTAQNVPSTWALQACCWIAFSRRLHLRAGPSGLRRRGHSIFRARRLGKDARPFDL